MHKHRTPMKNMDNIYSTLVTYNRCVCVCLWVCVFTCHTEYFFVCMQNIIFLQQDSLLFTTILPSADDINNYIQGMLLSGLYVRYALNTTRLSGFNIGYICEEVHTPHIIGLRLLPICFIWHDDVAALQKMRTDRL